MLGREGEFYRLRFHVDGRVAGTWLLHAGRLPLPPYIQRDADAADDARYQTVFARETGAVAAPTAGLHFDDALLRGVARARASSSATSRCTSAPARSSRCASTTSSEHACTASGSTSAPSWSNRSGARAQRGGRVIAVGTTVVRALESAHCVDGAAAALRRRDADLHPAGLPHPHVDALLTNFHLPESTLLMLVSAFAGKARIFAAYAHAIAQRYRFFSYGDAMLLWPSTCPWRAGERA